MLVNLDLLGLLAPWALPVLVEMKESKDLLDLLVTKAFKETKEFQVCRDCVDQEENPVLRERLVLKELVYKKLVLTVLHMRRMHT